MTVLFNSKAEMLETSVLVHSASRNSSPLIDGELYLHHQELKETKRFLVPRVLAIGSHLIPSTLS